MDETYGTYVDDECFGNHDYNDDADHDTDHGTDDAVDDDPTYDIDDDTDDGGSGNLYSIEVAAAGGRQPLQDRGSRNCRVGNLYRIEVPASPLSMGPLSWPDRASYSRW